MNLGVFNWLHVAKSEQWRWQWAFRTAVSIACIAFLSLFETTKKYLTRDGRHLVGPAFAGLVTGMAKDRKLGSTTINSWNLVLSCALACFLCWIVVIVKANLRGRDGSIPDGVILAIIFVLVLALQLMEIPPLGKKFACSIIPLLMLAVNTGLQPSQIWDFQIDAIIGAGCALIGNILPLPIESSTCALQERLYFCTHACTSLLVDIFRAWQHQSCVSCVNSASKNPSNHRGSLSASDVSSDSQPLSLAEKSRLQTLRQRSAAHSRLLSSPQSRYNMNGASDTAQTGVELRSPKRTTAWPFASNTHKVQNIDTDCFTNGRTEHRHWRKLRLLLMTVIQLKLNRGSGLGWYLHNNSSSSRFLRSELVAFLRDGLSELHTRNGESKFASISPLRRYYSTKYEKYASLLRDALIIVTILEQKIVAMEEAPQLNYIYRAFHALPMFRHALFAYVTTLCVALETIAECLVEGDNTGMHPTASPTASPTPAAAAAAGSSAGQPTGGATSGMQRCISAIASLLETQRTFDEVYFKCRCLVYYEHVDPRSKLIYTNEDRREARSPPLQADVLMNMNSFLFLLTALTSQVVQFWERDELLTVRDEVKDSRVSLGGSASECAGVYSGADTRNVGVNSWANWRHVLAQVPLALQDLFPSQVAAFAGFLPSAPAAQRQVALVRLRSAFSVAVSMSLASAYGLYLHRELPFIAAFTIAFLAGGPAAGATLVTSLNRAAGTVVACVWAIIVQLILDNGGSGHKHGDTSTEPTTQQQIIIGVAVVLLQFPATIVRSYPLQGYAGTCASFTICIMLFAPILDAGDSTDRIIDTFVGVAIYLAVESILATAYTEGILLSNMRLVFEGVQERYRGLQENFHQFKRSTTAHTDTDAQAEHHELRLQKLRVDPINARIKTQADILRYVELEPGLSRPPALPSVLLAECVELQTQAVNHLQVMYWAVRACAQEVPTHEIAVQCALYEDIAAHLHRTREVSKTGDGDDSAQLTPPSPHYIPCASEDPPDIPLPPDSPTQSRTEVGSDKKGSNPPSPPATTVDQPQTQFVLLPLERSLTEVGKYVALVVSFLKMCAKDLNPPDRRVNCSTNHTSATQESGENKNVLERLNNRVNMQSSARQEFQRHFLSANELECVLGEEVVIAKLEAEQVNALFARYQHVLAVLLNDVVDSVTTTVVIAGVRARTPRQNKEVRVVNAMIASSMDLVRALRGLAVVMSRLRAHREIRLTQTGTKVL